ncbi:MAG: hypothetical protein LBU65_07300 [Planctomycetaceae bacterium]|jgi:hypothetical protein|nr:hypothetical protein [Planctomycetaceae bacterium]
MKFNAQCILSLVLLGIFGGVMGYADSIPNGMDVLNTIMKSRGAIQRGYVEVETTYKDVRTPAVHKKWNIWFDGNKMRSEVTRNGNTDVRCLDCYSKQTLFYYTTQSPPSPSDGKMALTFFDGYARPSPSDYIPVPKWFGCTSLTIEASQYQFPLEMYGSKPDKYTKLPKVTSDVVANVDCWKVDYELPGAISYSVWVDKLDQRRVLSTESRFEAEENGKKVLFIDRVDSETENYQDKIWFPVKLVYKRTENGKVTCDAETRIKIHSLNKPLPSDTFSPKGVSFLMPDTPVAWHLDRDRPVAEGELVWNGNEVVAANELLREPTRLRPFNIFLMLLGIALICIGLGMKFWKKDVR